MVKKQVPQQLLDLKKTNKGLRKEVDLIKKRLTEVKFEKEEMYRDNARLKMELKRAKESIEEHKKEIEMLYEVINNIDV
jgi:peptidoglycan hydrolase CwlO-like protein